MNSITSQKRASVGYESVLVPGGFDCHLQTGESNEEDPVSRDPPRRLILLRPKIKIVTARGMRRIQSRDPPHAREKGTSKLF